MSAEPPAGYNPEASMLSGAGNSTVPIIKMSGGGDEPPSSYTSGGYTQSLLPGGDAPVVKMTGGGNGLSQEALDKLKITQNEFSELDDTAGLSYEEFMEAIITCNSVSNLDKTRCDAAKTVLRQIFIQRLQNYIEECQGFVATGTAGEVKLPTAAGLATKMATALGAKPKAEAEAPIGALPQKLIQDPSTGVWRAPKEYENADAAITPEKGQWVPGAKPGEWKPAPITKAVQSATPGKVGGPKYLRRLPDGNFVATTQSDPQGKPVDPSVTYVPGTKPGQWVPGTPAAVEVVPKPTAPTAPPAAIVGEIPYGPEPKPGKAPETPQEAASKYAKIKFIFELIDFLPTLRTNKNFKPIPQPDINTYTYKSLIDLIRATIAIFGYLLTDTRSNERKEELSRYNIPTDWESIDITIKGRRVIPDDIRSKLLNFITQHETLIQIRGKEDREIIEGIYSQVFNFIKDIANVPVYNKLGDQSSQLISYGSIIDEKIPELTQSKGILGFGKQKKQDINYITVFFAKAFPSAAPADYKITVFAWRNGLPKHFERDLTTADKVSETIIKEIKEPVKIAIEEKGFNMMMRRLFSKYKGFNEDDIKTFETLHDKISGYDLLYNLFIKHDSNPFSASAETFAGPNYPEYKTLEEYAKIAIARLKTFLEGTQAGGSEDMLEEEQVGGAVEDALWTLNVNAIKPEETDNLINILNETVTKGMNVIKARANLDNVTKLKSYRNIITDYIVIFRLLLNTYKVDEDIVKKNKLNEFLIKIHDVLVEVNALFPANNKLNDELVALKADSKKVLSVGEFDSIRYYLTKEQLTTIQDYAGEFLNDILEDYAENAKEMYSLTFPTDTTTGEQVILKDEELLQTPILQVLQHFGQLIGSLKTQFADAQLFEGKDEVYNFFTGDQDNQIRNDEFILEYIITPIIAVDNVNVAFNELQTKLQKKITNGDLQYITNIVEILNLNAFRASVEYLYNLHDQNRTDSKYHYSIDKFGIKDIMDSLGTDESMTKDSYDLMRLLIDQSKKYNDENIQLCNAHIYLQILLPYFKVKLSSFLESFNNVKGIFDTFYAAVALPSADLTNSNNALDRVSNLLTTAKGGKTDDEIVDYFIENLFGDDEKIANDFNKLFNNMSISGQYAIIDIIPDNEEQQNILELFKFDLINGQRLFGAWTNDTIIKLLLDLKVMYSEDPSKDGKSDILNKFFAGNEAQMKAFVDDVKNPENIEIFNNILGYFAAQTTDENRQLLSEFIEYYHPYYERLKAAKTPKKTKGGMYGGAAASQIELKDPSRYSYFTNGIKFIEYPADIFCGKPGSLEREKFIELLVALFCRLLHTIFAETNTKTQKEYLKAFFFLLNQMDIYMYSIGEKNNEVYNLFLEFIMDNDRLYKFMKIAYLDYFKQTTDKGRDKSFIPKQTLEYIGDALLQRYPEFTKRAWFGGGSRLKAKKIKSKHKKVSKIIKAKQKGGFNIYNPFAYLAQKVSTIAYAVNFFNANRQLNVIKKTYIFNSSYIGIDNIRIAIRRLRVFNKEYKNVMANVDEGGQKFYDKYPIVLKYILPNVEQGIDELKAFDKYLEDLTKADSLGEDIKTLAYVLKAIAVNIKNYIKANVIGSYQGPDGSIKREIFLVQQEIYSKQIGEETADKLELIDRLEDDKDELKYKLTIAYQHIGSISTVEDTIINKLINVLACNLGEGYSGFPSKPSGPPPTDQMVEKFKYKSKEYKLYAGDFILYVKNIHKLMKEKSKDTSKLLLKPIPAEFDKYMTEADKFFDNLYTNTLKNIANIDEGLYNGVLMNYVRNFVGPQGLDKEKNFLYLDDAIGSWETDSSKISQRYFVSDNTYRVYINNTNNLERGAFIFDKHLKFMKELQGHFRNLIGPLSKPQIYNNQLIEPFNNNPVIGKILKTLKSNPPKPVKGKGQQPGDKQKDENKTILNSCFNFFMESPDAYEFEDFFATLFFVINNPKLDSIKEKKFLGELTKNKKKYEDAYKFLLKYLDLPADYAFIPPPGYLEPTVFIQGPPPKRLRFRMAPLATEDVPYAAITKDVTQFIANREAFNLLFDSIESRLQVYNNKIKDIEKQRKQKLPNVSYPDIDSVKDDNREQLQFLAAVLYGYGRKARCEFLGLGEEGECPEGFVKLQNIKEGSDAENILKGYTKFSATAGVGLTYKPTDLEDIVKKVDLNKLDIEAPPYMFMTTEQRMFAFKFCEEKIKELSYLEVLNLLLRLLNNYDVMGVNKDEIITTNSAKESTTNFISNASMQTLNKLKTASLVVRYDGLAKQIVKNVASIPILGIQRAPMNYSTRLNSEFGNASIKLLEEERMREEGITEDTLLDDLAEELPEYDYTAANISQLGSLTSSPSTSGGAIKRLVAKATARARSQYSKSKSTTHRRSTARKNIHREHNKHTRKNK